MGGELIELYSDYLLCSSRQTTATGLAELSGGMISHDSITRFLSGEKMDEKTLWLRVKKLVRQYENEEACLVFDDTIIEKPYMDENEIVTWNWDHGSGRAVKSINLLTAFYTTEQGGHSFRIPTGYRIIQKTETYTDGEGKEKRRSKKTKNELMQEMISMHIKNQVKFRYILADSWFSSSENMRFIAGKKKKFIFEIKENRLSALNEEEREQGLFKRIDERDIPERTPIPVLLKDLSIPVVLFKEVFENKDGSRGVRFLVSNDLTLTKEQFEILYKKRWGIEEYHKSLKQNASIGKSPARTERTQSNHIFSAIYAYIKLEVIKLVHGINHFSLKAWIYMESMKSAMDSFPVYSNAFYKSCVT